MDYISVLSSGRPYFVYRSSEKQKLLNIPSCKINFAGSIFILY